MIRRTLALAALIAAAAGPAAEGQAQQPEPAAVRFVVFMAGRQLGFERAQVRATADGWTLSGSGRLADPVDLRTGEFQVRYDRDWRPLGAEISATLQGEPSVTKTTFANGSATSEITRRGKSSWKVDAVSADPVVLPPKAFFSAFEALALRLRTAPVPAALRGYIVGQGEIAIAVTAVGDERFQTMDGAVDSRRYTLTIEESSGPVEAELWANREGRLLRFRVPANALEVSREDVAAVSTRVERLARPNDEAITVAAFGFNLAGTLSKPASVPAAAGRAGGKAPALPAVVLVSGGGFADRDENVAGVPVFAQLAGALADAGFAVVRYDKRGLGQSGGRSESATAGDYAEDARAVVRHLRKRRDIDPRRIALVGYGEGGFVAMLAAAGAKDDVAALALMAAPGSKGSDLVMEQQLRLIEKMALPDAERQQRVELQERLHHAVITGTGWDTVPPGYREQADTAWFRSLLLFDPARVMEKVRQPVLVVHGDIDRQVPARHGALLIEAARARKRPLPAALVTIQGINHLLVPAATGEPDEYATLPDRRVSPKVPEALVPWLKDTLHVGAAGPAH